MRLGQALAIVVLLLAVPVSAAQALPRVSLTAKPRAGGAVRVTAVAHSPFRGSLVLAGARPIRVAALRLRKGARRTLTLSAPRLRTLGAGCRLELRLATRGGARVRRVRVARPCAAATPASPTAPGGVASPPAAARAPQAAAPAPAATPIPAAPPVMSIPLRWAPPALTSPTVVELGTGPTYTRMDPARDYMVVLPDATKVGGTVLDGGHNVVVIGGRVTVPDAGPGSTDAAAHRALYVKNATGTVHLEGIAIDGSGGGESDAIAISAPQATVQVENVRATGIRGGYSTWHADVIQPWGGVKDLRVDGLTASSNYQALQLNRDQGPIGSATLRRVDLSQDPGPYDMGGFMLWLTSGSACTGYPVSLDEVYIAPRGGRTLRTSVWPEDQTCRAALPITGAVRRGPPPDGPFVPAGTAGTDYRSPGYAAG
jgi:hypothetical protein